MPTVKAAPANGVPNAVDGIQSFCVLRFAQPSPFKSLAGGASVTQMFCPDNEAFRF